jgi:hypothetical protein
MLREFTDKSGIPWRVWDVYPSPRVGGAAESVSPADAPIVLRRFKSPELAEGWLCFESPTERRRVAPIPQGWETWDAFALETACADAGYVSRRTSGEERRRA